MTVLGGLSRARRQLLVALVVASALWAIGAALGVLALALLFSRIPGIRLATLAVPVAVTTALAAMGVSLWRGRQASSLTRFALWVEEQEGGLDHALVTVAESGLPAATHPELHRRAAESDPAVVVRRVFATLIGWPLALTFAGAAAFYLLGPIGRLGAASSANDLRHRSADLVNRLRDVSVLVESPPYAGRPVETLHNPATVAALTGSRLVLEGSGASTGLVARIGKDSVVAGDSASAWRLAVRMPADPVVITLAADANRRLLALVPVPDSVPVVRLRLPTDDTTYRTVPHGDLVIEAALHDDIGLGWAQVEYMISTGSDEDFQTRVSLGHRLELSGARAGSLREIARFDTLHLAPGSVVHIRVVAWDRNDVHGPGKGASETRTLRVAEPVDSTDAEAAPPPPIDSMWISQRLLNMKTDTLIAQSPGLTAAALAQRSEDYSVIQESLRQHTLSVIGEIEGDPDDPTSTTTAITRTLRQVAELMVTARTHLSAAAPEAAMPFMRRILKTLDALRLANRYYLRGHPRPKAVDLARTRLTGTDPRRQATRDARTPSVDPSASLAARLDRIVDLSAHRPGQARDSLTVLRVETAGTAPALAPLLDAALERSGKGVAMDSALAPVRRALVPSSSIERGPVTWSPVP